MIASGMDVARLNMSHSDHSFHREVHMRVRDLSADAGRHVSIMYDIQGPKVRTGKVEPPLTVKSGEFLEVIPGRCEAFEGTIFIDYPDMVKDLDKGDEIFINDGLIRMTVRDKTPSSLVCRVDNGGTISSYKGCNIPSGNLSLAVPTEKDEEDLAFIAGMDPDHVAVSFVNRSEDIERVRSFLSKAGRPDVRLIAKIERPSALNDLDRIIKASDAVMVARGDLGVEIPPDRVPAAQKEIVHRCNRAGKPVIVATQMLESMLINPRPTRAEANDVYNAVIDGADALMLSAESSTGRYPVEAVGFMDRIARTAEENMTLRDPDYFDSGDGGMFEAAGHTCFTLAKEIREAGRKGIIIAITGSGFSARMISKYRPPLPIIAMSPEARTCRELGLVWGIQALHAPELRGEDLESRALHAMRIAHGRGSLDRDHQVVLVFTSLAVGDSGIFTAVYDASSIV